MSILDTVCIYMHIGVDVYVRVVTVGYYSTYGHDSKMVNTTTTTTI